MSINKWTPPKAPPPPPGRLDRVDKSPNPHGHSVDKTADSQGDAAPAQKPPVPMLLFCPSCGVQHIDRPQPEKGWDNPPHRSHECQGCGYTWRPSDHYTVGVATIATKGSKDASPVPNSMTAELRTQLESTIAFLHRRRGELVIERDECENHLEDILKAADAMRKAGDLSMHDGHSPECSVCAVVKDYDELRAKIK